MCIIHQGEKILEQVSEAKSAHVQNKINPMSHGALVIQGCKYIKYLKKTIGAVVLFYEFSIFFSIILSNNRKL